MSAPGETGPQLAEAARSARIPEKEWPPWQVVNRVRALMGFVVAIQQENVNAMVPDPDGPYPACKPVLGGRSCMRCGRDVVGRFDACPAVPREKRWRFKSPNAPRSATANEGDKHGT